MFNSSDIESDISTQLEKDLYCNICEISVNSQQQLTQHLESTKHKLRLSSTPTQKSNIREDRKSHELLETPHMFNSSGIEPKSPIQMEKNLGCVRQQSKITSESAKTLQPEASENITFTDPLPGCISKLNKTTDLYCNLCKKTVNSKQQLTHHLGSKNHRLVSLGFSPKPWQDSSFREIVSHWFIDKLIERYY